MRNFSLIPISPRNRNLKIRFKLLHTLGKTVTGYERVSQRIPIFLIVYGKRGQIQISRNDCSESENINNGKLFCEKQMADVDKRIYLNGYTNSTTTKSNRNQQMRLKVILLSGWGLILSAFISIGWALFKLHSCHHW